MGLEMINLKRIIQKLNSFDYVYFNGKQIKQIILNANDEIEIILENKEIIYFFIGEIFKIMDFKNLIIFKMEKKFIIFKVCSSN